MDQEQLSDRVDKKINVKIKLAALWTAMMVLYIYADILSLFKPGQIDEIRSGMMGPFQASQESLLLASILMIIPACMIFLSIILRQKVNRIVNLSLGVLYTLVNISNLIGENWYYYILFGLVEIGITILVFVTAWKWPMSNTHNA